MSGGEWGYQQFNIEAEVEAVMKLAKAVAETEGIVDWAVSGDARREDAEHKLFDLWVATFNEVYGS